MATLPESNWNTRDPYNETSCSSESSGRRISMELDLPGGVITTRCVSSVIRPGSKATHDPLQFVKIQSTELSKKAVEQIRLAEEVKITKEKIKEVEEEWQNNLLNWKSKRRQSRSFDRCQTEEVDNNGNHNGGGRKIRTFTEILNERAKSGGRINYSLLDYVRDNEENSSPNSFESNLYETNNGRDQACNKDNNKKSSSDEIRQTDDRLNDGSDDGRQNQKRIEWSETKESSTDRNDKLETANHHQFVPPRKSKEINCVREFSEKSQISRTLSNRESITEMCHNKINRDASERSRNISEVQPNKQSESKNEPRQTNDEKEEPTFKSFRRKLSTFESMSNSVGVINPQLRPKVSSDKCRDNSPTNKEKDEETLMNTYKIYDFVQQSNIVDNRSKSNQGKKLEGTHRELHRTLPVNGNENVLYKNESNVSTGAGYIHEENEMCKSTEQLRISSKIMPLKVKPTVPIRPYLQRDFSLMKDDSNFHQTVVKTISNSSEKSVSSENDMEIHPMTYRKENCVQQSKNNSSRLSNYLLRGPRPYQNPRISQKNSCPLLVGSQEQANDIKKRNLSNLQVESTNEPNGGKKFQPISKSLSTPNMSSHTLSHQPIANWIFQRAEIKRRNPAAPSVFQSPTTKPIISDEIFGCNSQSSNCLGKRASSEIQLPHNSVESESTQDRKTLSVSGKKRCSNCGDELARGSAAMVIEALSLYYHINCFRCSICHIQLGSGTNGTDVRVRNKRLHCQSCHSSLEVTRPL